jgi:hypothetical protein
MALFDVPGWTISDEPVSVVPKRRKRSSGHDPEKVSFKLASANIEKLMEQLVASPAAGSTPVTGKSGVVSARCDQPPKKNCKHAKGNENRQPHNSCLAARRWLEPRKDLSPLAPLSITVSISGDDGGVCNFLAILDQGLLKSHSLLKYAKRGASILIATSWLVPGLVSNPSTEAVSLFRDEGLHLYINDARSMAFDVGPHGE